MIEILHQHGGELHHNTVMDNSPLTLAVMNDSEGAVALLMKMDAKMANWKNASNWTAIHLAASRNAPQILQILSRFAEVDLNAVTENGHTALAIAVMQASSKATEVLLKAKANPDVPNTKGWSALHIAAEKGASDLVGLLCEAGANTEVQTDLGSTPLCIAAMHGHSDAVAELLRQNANPNARNQHGYSAIHYAAANNAEKMVSQFGQADRADLDLKTTKGNTPLTLAITLGAADAAKALVGTGADVNVKGPEEWSALHFAVNQDELKVIAILNDNRADVNAMCDKQKTPLMLAVKKGSVEAVRLLLDKCADPNLKDLCGWSALHMAAVSNETAEILQFIVRNGVNVNSLTNKGNTALALSVMQKSVGCAEALLLGKADPNMCGSHGWSPLHLAAERNYAEVVELLCSFSADPNATNQHGYTPLVISVAKDSKEAACALLKNKANPNVQSELNGWSALHFAVQEDNQDLCELLCDFEADLDVRTHENNPPLLIAALNSSTSMTSTLLARKADVNAYDSHGWTALHCAAQENASEIIPILCASSADCNAKTDKGNTPLAIAAIHSGGVATEELIKLGADLNAKNCDDWTPLCCAVYRGSFPSELIGSLCTPINVCMLTKQHGLPLHLCDMKHNRKYAMCLLKHGAQRTVQEVDGTVHSYTIIHDESGTAVGVAPVAHDMAVVPSEEIDYTGTDKYGNTPLHYAVHEGQKDMVKTILEQKEELARVKGDKGYLPIHVAALKGNTDIIEVFLQHDIGLLSLQADNGYTVLHCAAERGQVEVVEFICNKYQDSVNVNAVTEFGETPLHVASIYKTANADMIEELRLFGADVYASDNFNDTALHFAVLRDDEEKARALLTDAADLVDMAGASGEVPLHWAVKKSSSTMIDTLCEANCDVSAGDQHGNTPLHFATAYTRNEAIVQQLLANGAAPEKPNCEGHTPMDFAASKDARSCFMAIHDKAEEAYHIDKVYYNMRRVHEYVTNDQMDKAGRLMSDSISNVQ